MHYILNLLTFFFIPLQLVYNRQQLIELIDKDIKEAGLENAAVNFNFS